MRASVLFLSLIPLSAAAADCDNYCVAIRGNGEAEPAHPSALARMVEDFGMPKTMAGGSSASVTMYLGAQVKANQKAATETDPERKRKLQALLLKSMPEFEAAMTKDAKLADGFGLAQVFGTGDPAKIQEALGVFQKAGDLSKPELEAALQKYGMLLNPELVKLVEQDPDKFGKEAVKSIMNLGKFNAVTDDTLLFRPGLVDFKGVAVVLGYMGDFYSGNTDPDTKAKLDKFLDDCADSTYHKEWQDAPESCRTEMQTIAADYLKTVDPTKPAKSLFEKVDSDWLPVTGVLQGDGMNKYLRTKRDYLSGTAKNIQDFSVDFKKDIGFGYWSSRPELDAVNHGLEKYREEGDVKAKKFHDLGQPNWFEVLSTSPAEPGIANAQRIPTQTTAEQVAAELQKPLTKRWSGLHYRKDVLSIGGWADLQPTEVLKATPGCDRTVYLTRHADYGDSKFAQQILVRLTGTQKQLPFWDKIDQGGPGGWCDDKIKAAGGDPDQVRDTPWNQIFNLCNPQSSFRRSLDAADGSYCTNWDDASNEVFDGKMWALVKDAYEAPLIPTTAVGASCKLNNPPVSPDPRSLPSCLPYAKRGPGSKPVPEEEKASGPAE